MCDVAPVDDVEPIDDSKQHAAPEIRIEPIAPAQTPNELEAEKQKQRIAEETDAEWIRRVRSESFTQTHHISSNSL